MENNFLYCPFFFLVISIFFAIRFAVFQKNLFRYLCINHTDKWKDLTTVFGFGPGLANGVKGFRFFFNQDYFNDPEVLRLKVIVRNSFLYVILGFMTTFVTFIFVVGLQTNS